VHGYINAAECVQLIVMRNGDTTGNDLVDVSDVLLLANYAAYPGQYAINSEFVADVTGDGAVGIVDALLLNHVVNPDRYILRQLPINNLPDGRLDGDIPFG
ncbi:MAG: dockerin type I domain-containing protein, partial [Euryarchaeota archaeon]|nr:dockerin type I domain-containing protein [Euryarchaeota archaeon]